MDVYLKISLTSMIVLLATTMIMDFQKEFQLSRWVMGFEILVWALSFVSSTVFMIIFIWVGQ